MLIADGAIKIDKALEILGPGSGVADVFGNVLFGHKKGETIVVPDEKDADGDGFAAVDGDTRLFCLLRTAGHELIWIFGGSEDNDSTRRLLKIAITLGEAFFYSVAGQRNGFFKQLLLGGFQNVSSSEFAIYTQNLSQIATEFTVVRIEVVRGSKDSADEVAIDELEECLHLVFPTNDGFCHTRMDSSIVAVVCPINEENSFKSIQSVAADINDTVLSELMLSTIVSVGGRVKSVKNLDMAYKSAERAGIIGNIFEIDEKCFSFDSLGAARLIYGLPRETCLTYLREIFGTQFIEERTKKTKAVEFTDEILNTIRVFLKLNQNVSEASRALYIHRNTLIYRIEKFNKLTGLDCANFEDGMKIQLGFMILKYIMKTNG